MFDFILVIVFGLMVFLGWKNGFAKSVMSLLGYVLAVVAAYYSYKPIASWLATTPYASWVAKLVGDNVTRPNIPLLQMNLSWLPSDVHDGIRTAMTSGADASFDAINATISQVFISLTALVLVFVLAFILLKVLTFILNLFMNFPVLSIFNKLFGMFVGIINGVLLVYIIILVSLTLSPYVPEVGEACRQSGIRMLFL